MIKPGSSEVCTSCNGTGTVDSIIPDITQNCHDCGGFGWVPTSEDPLWFYKPGNNNLTQRIAVVLPGDRVTKFSPEGPVTHHESEDVAGLMREVRGMTYSPVAARLLDYWSTKPIWEVGMQRMQYLALWNLLHITCPEKLRLATKLSLEHALREMWTLKAQYAPEVCIWD